MLLPLKVLDQIFDILQLADLKSLRRTTQLCYVAATQNISKRRLSALQLSYALGESKTTIFGLGNVSGRKKMEAKNLESLIKLLSHKVNGLEYFPCHNFEFLNFTMNDKRSLGTFQTFIKMHAVHIKILKLQLSGHKEVVPTLSFLNLWVPNLETLEVKRDLEAADSQLPVKNCRDDGPSSVVSCMNFVALKTLKYPASYLTADPQLVSDLLLACPKLEEFMTSDSPQGAYMTIQHIGIFMSAHKAGAIKSLRFYCVGAQLGDVEFYEKFTTSNPQLKSITFGFVGYRHCYLQPLSNEVKKIGGAVAKMLDTNKSTLVHIKMEPPLEYLHQVKNWSILQAVRELEVDFKLFCPIERGQNLDFYGLPGDLNGLQIFPQLHTLNLVDCYIWHYWQRVDVHFLSFVRPFSIIQRLHFGQSIPSSWTILMAGLLPNVRFLTIASVSWVAELRDHVHLFQNLERLELLNIAIVEQTFRSTFCLAVDSVLSGFRKKFDNVRQSGQTLEKQEEEPATLTTESTSRLKLKYLTELKMVFCQKSSEDARVLPTRQGGERFSAQVVPIPGFMVESVVREKSDVAEMEELMHCILEYMSESMPRSCSVAM